MNIGNDNNKTMETNEKLSDELIAKYISGTTTEEEDNLIHDYLAKNPEFADDLLDIATALRHQRKHEETTGTVGSGHPQETAHVISMRRRTFLAIAASIVVLISIGLLVFKPFSHNETEQSQMASSNTETPNVTPSPSEEGIGLDSTAITPIDLQPDEPLLADNHETPSQKPENTSQPQPEVPSLADNTVTSTPQQQEVAPQNDNASTMAALTTGEDYSNLVPQKDAIFVTDSIPVEWDPQKDLVLKWTCNTPSLKLEFSTDRGSTWKTPYDVSGQNSFMIRSRRLQDFSLDNPQGFNWRLTAQFSDGKLVRQGSVKFSDVNQ